MFDCVPSLSSEGSIHVRPQTQSGSQTVQSETELASSNTESFSPKPDGGTSYEPSPPHHQHPLLDVDAYEMLGHPNKKLESHEDISGRGRLRARATTVVAEVRGVGSGVRGNLYRAVATGSTLARVEEEDEKQELLYKLHKVSREKTMPLNKRLNVHFRH
mmetsp:Transcript_39632/g.74432  ORF Transcript_39632/g.74432 Transcript_39632/m.74432 type:complete len:160 (+) Transcript_39632:363-842(+)